MFSELRKFWNLKSAAWRLAKRLADIDAKLQARRGKREKAGQRVDETKAKLEAEQEALKSDDAEIAQLEAIRAELKEAVDAASGMPPAPAADPAARGEWRADLDRRVEEARTAADTDARAALNGILEYLGTIDPQAGAPASPNSDEHDETDVEAQQQAMDDMVAQLP